MDVITYSIPLFFLLIGLELAVARARGRAVYRFADAVTALSCGVTSQVVGLVLGALLLVPYAFIAHTYGVLSLDMASPAAWIAAFILVDLAYYAWHRASHRVAFIWATHEPHHQSQDYNLAVALRQSMFASVTSFPFYLPLAWLGVPVEMFITCSALNTVLQFWIHTELVGRLGPLEWVLNTPSHHRVHHGVNPRYIDTNYAGVFIVWDRLFGTFVEESEPVVYGTVAGFRSWNPVWANVEPWVRMWGHFRAARGWERAYVWVAPPEWKPVALGPPTPVPEVSPERTNKWGEPVKPGLQLYVAAWFVVTAGVLVLLLLGAEAWEVGLGGAMILLTTVSWGAAFERRFWAARLEALRLVGVLGLLPILVSRIGAWGWALGLMSALSLGVVVVDLRRPADHRRVYG